MTSAAVRRMQHRLVDRQDHRSGAPSRPPPLMVTPTARSSPASGSRLPGPGSRRSSRSGRPARRRRRRARPTWPRRRSARIGGDDEEDEDDGHRDGRPDDLELVVAVRLLGQVTAAAALARKRKAMNSSRPSMRTKMTTAIRKIGRYRPAAAMPSVVTTSCGKPMPLAVSPNRLGAAPSPVGLLLACSVQAASTRPTSRDRGELGKATTPAAGCRDAQGLSPVSRVPSSGPGYYSGLDAHSRAPTCASPNRPLGAPRDPPSRTPTPRAARCRRGLAPGCPRSRCAHGQAPIEPTPAILIEGWSFAVDVWLPVILAALVYWQARNMVNRRHPAQPGAALAPVVLAGGAGRHRPGAGLAHRVLRHHALLGAHGPAPAAVVRGRAAAGAGGADHAAAAGGLAGGATQVDPAGARVARGAGASRIRWWPGSCSRA